LALLVLRVNSSAVSGLMIKRLAGETLPKQKFVKPLSPMIKCL
jgi:hypothetical protein